MNRLSFSTPALSGVRLLKEDVAAVLMVPPWGSICQHLIRSASRSCPPCMVWRVGRSDSDAAEDRIEEPSGTRSGL
jgi:hypothetical protein